MSKLWSKYENWLKQEKQNRVYRYTPNMYQYMLGSGRVYRYTFKVYRYLSPENAQNVYFLPFSIFLIPNSTLYSINTSKPFQIHLGISFLFNSSFNFISVFKNPSWISSKTLLIWVTTHTQIKHEDYLGFILNPNSITCNLT